ncbi:hypothetical protein MUG84_09890 [Paenibacillus sp. KQZ6P-2]|uniref:Uncharacterized protein n=1 Tax=Paenibacillus mangrovi TaxID=2931978 RepID=A0A9X1WN89_9BACL|nr:hypothetical protein [Paenibacillus mangrovi]MCJ8012053.1 hypothetical protein [Paenibacillus mangrovi]
MLDKPNPTNKTRGWLKNILNARTGSPAAAPLDSQGEMETDEVESLQGSHEADFSLLEQDKVALDLVVAVENLLNDRQLASFKIKDNEQQLQNANESINRLKNELSKKEHFILEKEKEFRSLEDKLTHKQMSYDQLLEDYKEYQNSSNSGIENLKYQLEKERNKYVKLNDEFSHYQYESMKKAKELEERIRDLESENQKVESQYQKVLEEKNHLLQTISDFTARMNFSLTPPSE